MNDFECVDIVNGKIITVGKLDGYPIVKHYKFRPSFPEWLDHVPYHQVESTAEWMGMKRKE